ncbi:MAG: UvrD-helicase domain-containing protein [Verrucomicrobiota bacterium]
MTELVDQEARHRFTNELDQNICISASAGAGKTRAIVDRVEALVQRPFDSFEAPSRDPMERLVVVTYGEMAAQELKVRCRQRLLSGSYSTYQKNRILNRFDQAYFGTIHSFCLKLLRQYGGALGLPSQVRLLSERDSVFWDRFKQTLSIDNLAWPETWAEEVLRYHSLDEVFAMAERMTPEQIKRYLRMSEKKMPVADVQALLDFTPPRKNSIPTVQRLQRQLSRWDQARLAGAPFLYLPTIKGGGKEFMALNVEILNPLREWIAEGLVVMAAHIAEAFRGHRLDNLRLTYDDMISEAVRLIEVPEILDQIRKKQWIVILDEAQDTDAQMFRVLTEITRPPGAIPGAWPNSEEAEPPGPGQFSFVGDDQQCIYSSRADIGQYLAYVRAYEEGRGGDRVEFSVTMRCPEPVVAEVNRIFPGRIQQSHAVFRTMVSSPFSIGQSSDVVRLPMNPGEDLKRDDDLFRFEVEQLAQWLNQHGLNGLGVASWSEVAVLCPRIRWLSLAGRVFEDIGLPIAHKSSGLLNREQPVQSWPYALVHVLAYPFDRFELIGVLRDIFTISDQRIYRLHREDPNGLSLFSRSEVDRELTEILQWLCDAHASLIGQSQEKTPYGRLVRSWCDEIELESRLGALSENVDALEVFYCSAEEASRQGLSVWDWLEEQRLMLDEKSPPMSSQEGIDLISCHKSKGLEWPVVVMVGLWRKIYQATPDYPVIQSRGREMRVLANKDSAGSEWVNSGVQNRDEELQRLFYVGMTRTKRLLILSDVASKCGDPSFSKLVNWDDVKEDIPEALPQSDPICSTGQLLETEELDFESTQALKAWSRRVPERLLPHALAEDLEEIEDNEFEELLIEPGVGGVVYGSLWHEWVEQFPWQERSRRRAEYFADQKFLEGVESDLAKRLQKEQALLCKSEWFETLLSVGVRFFPEIPFTWAKSSNEWMEGVIDLVVELPDSRWLVLDWKTNRPGSGENRSDYIERVKAYYWPQLDAYARVLKSQLPEAVVQTGIYLTYSGDFIELEVSK